MTKTRPDARKDVLFKTGTPIIPGVCYGRCLVLSSDDALKDVKLVRTEDVEGEKRLIKAAIEKAGSTDGDALAAALTSLQVSGVTGTMTWTADGNTSKTASAILYYDGVGTLFDSQE